MREIKLQYDGNKCSKCGREMKKGWTGFFEVIKENGKDVKKLYCTICERDMKKAPAQPEPEISLEKETLSLSDRLDSIDNKLGRLVNTYAIIKQYIEAERVKTTKTTKKK